MKKRFARTFEGIRRLGISDPLPSRIYHPYLEITYKRGGGDETYGVREPHASLNIWFSPQASAMRFPRAITCIRRGISPLTSHYGVREPHASLNIWFSPQASAMRFPRAITCIRRGISPLTSHPRCTPGQGSWYIRPSMVHGKYHLDLK